MPCPAGPWHHGSMATAGRRRDDQTCVGFPRPHFLFPIHIHIHIPDSTHLPFSATPKLCHLLQHPSTRRHAVPGLPGAQAHLVQPPFPLPAAPVRPLPLRPRACRVILGTPTAASPLQHFIRFLSAANPPTATNGTSADPTKSLQGETPDALPSASSYHRKDAITDQVAEYPDPLADNRIASCVETGRLRARGHGRDEGRLPRQRPFAA